MADVGDILNDNEFFGDVVDTPKESIEQHKKQEELKSVIDKGKAHLLGRKWSYGRVDKASNEIINKRYAEYRQHELNKKGEKTGKALGKHVINLYSTGISQWLKIKDVKKIRQDIENDPIIEGQIANLGCLFVSTFGDYLLPILIASHTANNVDFDSESGDEDYESGGTKDLTHPRKFKIKMSVILKYLPWNWLVCREPYALGHVPDHLKTQEIVKKLLKKIHGGCTLSLIVLKPKGWVKKQLKMNQKP